MMVEAAPTASALLTRVTGGILALEGGLDMEYRDRVLRCVDCGIDFVFSSGEQFFYAEKGFRNEPKRCKTCKMRRGQPGNTVGMAKQRSVTSTTCSQCGKDTTVPFKLTQGRPVFCRECYQQRRAAHA
jgi:CxxC-x17-CxxC domain-containing protein